MCQTPGGPTTNVIITHEHYFYFQMVFVLITTLKGLSWLCEVVEQVNAGDHTVNVLLFHWSFLRSRQHYLRVGNDGKMVPVQSTRQFAQGV